MVSTDDCKQVLHRFNLKYFENSRAKPGATWVRQRKYKVGEDVMRDFINKDIPVIVTIKEDNNNPVVVDQMIIPQWDFYKLTSNGSIIEQWNEAMEEEEYWEQISQLAQSPDQFVFAIKDDPDMGMILILTPKSYWIHEGHMFDQHFDVDLPDFIHPTDEMEGAWSFDEEMSVEDAVVKLKAHGFVYDEDFVKFAESF